MITLATNSNFNELINKELVLVDFYATWCGPCKMLAPVLEKLENIDIVKVDVDECMQIAKEYAVMSVPTLIIFKNGNIISKSSGYMPLEALKDWINKNV